MKTIQELLNVGECEWVDFKEKHHENKADLVHDVLCMANADHTGDRYLVFGVRDTDRSIVGVENDSARRNQASIINLLQSLRLNKLPAITLSTLREGGHEIDLLAVKNLPQKPYYVLQDYLDGRERVRVGAVYIRVGDTNTPKDRTADDHRVEHMYRERMGLHLPPSERIKIYLRDLDNWKRDYNEESRQYFFYVPFPEFTLVEIKDGNDQFDEPWVRVFPDSRASRSDYHVKYQGTILEKVYLGSV